MTVSQYDFQFWTGFNPKSQDCYAWASDKAYLDMGRTLTYKESTRGKPAAVVNKIESARKVFRDDITGIIRREISAANQKTDLTFDEWHKGVCNEIIACSYRSGLLVQRNTTTLTKITVGQAQKWLNMTLKYLWLLRRIDTSTLNLAQMLTDQNAIKFIDIYQKNFHVPLDSYILKWVNNTPKNKAMPFPATGNGLSKSISLSFSVEWSKINRYESYLNYQRQLRAAVIGKSPIEWELENWLSAAEYYL